MKDTLQTGIEYEFTYLVPETKIVSALYPEAPEFQEMPRVFATGFLVGLVEWTCIQALMPHLDWPAEQTVGTHVNVSHEAATPPGMEVTARVRLAKINGRQLFFEIQVHDPAGIICRGTHERFVINREKFDRKLEQKGQSLQQ